MFGAREKIPTARITAPSRAIIAARARRGIGIAFGIGVHVVRAAVIVGGFATMMWFAAATSTRARVAEPVHKLPEASVKQLPFGFNIHRMNLLDLMSRAESIASHQRDDRTSFATE